MDYSTELRRGVQVTERGLLYYSDDLVNWIPREIGGGYALRSVRFMESGRCVLVGESGRVGYSDDLGAVEFLQEGRLNDGPVLDWLEGLAVAQGLCVAVGDAGTIYSSTNGVDWVRRSPPSNHWLTGVTHGPHGFVAVGELGTILQSADGIQWLDRSAGTGDWLGVTHGSGQYLVVGRAGRLATSADGTDWALHATGHTNDLWFAAIHGTSRLVGGTFDLMLSEKGGPWTDQFEQRLHPAPVGTYYCAITRTNWFLVAGRSGSMAEGYQPAEGLPHYWLDASPAVRSWLWDSSSVDGLRVVVGDRGVIMTSEDGVGWDLELPPLAVTNQTLLGVGGDDRQLIAVGTQGSLIRSTNQTVSITMTNIIDGVPVATNILSSTFGVVWTDVLPRPTTNQLQGVAAGHGIYAVVGDNGEIMTSGDGIQWLRRGSGITDLLSGLAAVSEGFAACGQSGVLLLGSKEGARWIRVESGTTRWLYRVRSEFGVAAVVGEGGTLLTREGSDAWVSRITPTSEFLTDVGWVGEWCLVSGLNGTLLASTNYVHWSQLNPFTYRDLLTLNVHRGQLLLSGEDGVILRQKLSLDESPVELLQFSRTADPLSGMAQFLFLFGGQVDQRFTIETAPDLRSVDWHPGPYLELRPGSLTLAYLTVQPLHTAPVRQYFRTRLLP